MSEPERSLQDLAYRHRFGTVEFDEARFELTVGGLRVDLERRPLEVLAMLLRHAGEVVTKDELLETIWTGRVTVENVLANAIAKLRKGIGEANAERIVTQARVGYRLTGPVERIAVGRRFANRLNLAAGQSVPQRENFVLERQLAGTSGSEVWLACHGKTGERRVYKFSPDGERLTHLKREATLSRVLRQGLGDRDDIARVMDWNFETPPFFLECEYGGENLGEWAEAEDRLAALTVQERLGLACQAVDAVVAAHEVGVLHKDLKPSNFLVSARKDGGWQVKIADFGSGSLVESAWLGENGITPLGFTLDDGRSSSSALGTPLFIAPEIIAGASPTVRSDIYSLGVLLYQILAGDIRKPMTTGWERDIADPLLCEDLAEATSGDPAGRTASAAILAEKLRTIAERHVARASREEAERAAAQVRRQLEAMRARRPWMAATLAVFAVGFGISLWLAGEAHEARHVAEAQAARAEATGAFLSDLLVNADPHAPGASGTVTVHAALERATTGIAARFASDPATEASIRMEAGAIYAGLADYAGAAEHHERAAALFEEMYGARDTRTLDVRYRYAETLANASRYDEAAAVLAAADKDSAGMLDAEPRLAFVAAQARGRFHLMRAEIGPAADAFEAALRLAAGAVSEDARTPFRLRMDLSQCYSRLGRHDEAIGLLEDLQDPRYAHLGVSAASRASASLYLGAALLYAARYDEAEPVLKRSIGLLTDVFGEGAPQVIEAYSSLGNLYATSGRWGEAQPVIATVREKMCAQHGDTHLTCMMATGNEGVIAFQLGRINEAIGKIGPARDAFEQTLGEGSPGVHVLGYYLAMAELDADRIDAAARHSEKLDPASLESGSPGEQWAQRVDGLKARILIARGQCDEGAPMLEAAISEMEQGGAQEWILEPYRKAAMQGCG
jgi:eukaryotic-like serine/threonine-protein kinase